MTECIFVTPLSCMISLYSKIFCFNECFRDGRRRDRGRRIWQEIYKSHEDAFDFRKEDSVLVHIENIAAPKSRDRTALMNYLPSECITEDVPVLLLDQKKFKEYIEYDKYFKKSFIKRWFR